VCASCGAPIVTAVGDEAEVSTHRLPRDVPPTDAGRDAYHRACRDGRVRGAVKRGRAWVCTLEAWNNRAPAKAPAIAAKKHRAKLVAKPTTRVDELLAELGGERCH
jgi:hypothetical protein